MINIFLAISFILFTISFLSPGTISQWNEVHQSIPAIAAALLFIAAAERKNNFFDKAQIFFITLAFFAFSFHILFHNTNQTSYVVIGIAYLLCSIRVQQTVHSFDKSQTLKYLTSAMVVAGAFSLFIQYYQAIGLSPHYWPWMYTMEIGQGSRPYANIGQPNILGSIYITSLCLIFWAVQEKLLSIKYLYAISIFYAAGLALTQSRTAYAALIALSILFFFQRKSTFPQKFYFPIVFFCTLIASELINTTTGMDRELSKDLNNQRFSIWMMGLDAIKEAPLFGYGFHETARATFHVIENNQPQNLLTAQIHNFFIDLMIWFGIPAGLILIALFLHACWDIFKKCYRTNYFFPALTLTPFTLHSMLEYPLYYANTLMLFSIVIGLTYSYLNSNEKIHKNI